jgi:hypothetical protein
MLAVVGTLFRTGWHARFMSGPLSRRVVQALSVYAIALLSADATRWSVDRWLRPPNVIPSLAATIRSGPRGLHVGNLTSAVWTECRLVIDGGYEAPPFTLPAYGTIRLAYEVFNAAGRRMLRDDGFARAFRLATLDCADAHRARQRATIH